MPIDMDRFRPGIRAARSPCPQSALPAFPCNSRWLALGLAVFFIGQTAIRLAFPHALESDEAQQVLWSQWLTKTYPGQPPLYTWIVIGLGRFSPSPIWTLAVLKNTLLLIFHLSVLAAGKRLFADPFRPVLATVSLFLIPQIAWESQRDLTHSVLAMSLAAMLFVTTLDLLRHPAPWRAGCWGVLAAALLLAKLNGLYVLIAISLAAAWTARNAQTRAALALAWLPAMLIAAPVLLALPAELSDTTAALRADAHSSLGGSLQSLVLATISFVLPFTLVWTLCFRPWRSKSPSLRQNFSFSFYFSTLLATLIFSAWVLSFPHFKDRWLQPLLFLVPLWAFSHTGDGCLAAARMRRFLRLSATIAWLILLLMPLRILLGPALADPNRMNVPYPALASQLETRGFQHGRILAADALTAGNLKLQFPGSAVVDPVTLARLGWPEGAPAGPCLWVWRATAERSAPPASLTRLATTDDLPLNPQPLYWVPTWPASDAAFAFGYALTQDCPDAD